MSAREMMAAVGKVVLYRVSGLVFRVAITDARMAYGALQYKIIPQSGKGETWVNAGSVEVEK